MSPAIKLEWNRELSRPFAGWIEVAWVLVAFGFAAVQAQAQDADRGATPASEAAEVAAEERRPQELTGVSQVLPTVIVFASMMSILYYLGIMQWVVRGMAYVVRRALGTSGPESLSVSANIFVGQTEAPLVIKPYLHRLRLLWSSH